MYPVSVSQCYIKFYMLSVMMCLKTRKCLFNVGIMTMLHSAFKKDTEKVVLLEVKGLIQIIVKFKAEKNLCTFLSIKHPFKGHEISITKTIVLI